jgi:hypothetical protein
MNESYPESRINTNTPSAGQTTSQPTQFSSHNIPESHETKSLTTPKRNNKIKTTIITSTNNNNNINNNSHNNHHHHHNNNKPINISFYSIQNHQPQP